jgi:hypothetical protein
MAVSLRILLIQFLGLLREHAAVDLRLAVGREHARDFVQRKPADWPRPIIASPFRPLDGS